MVVVKLMDNIKVKLSTGKEIEVNEDVVRILNKYARTQLTLEGLAAELNLSSWEEAYELVKVVPSWVMWTPLQVMRRAK